MSENNRPPRTRSGLPWTIQHFQENSHQFANTASQHIHDFQDYVFHGLCPLINSSSLRSPQNSPSHVPWSENSETASALQRNVSSPTPDSSSTSFVINMEEATSSTYELPNSNDLLDSNAESIGGGNRNNETDQGAAVLRNSPELQALFAFLEKYVPFLLILLLKLIFDHRIGILVNCGLFITFFHANSVVKREVSRQISFIDTIHQIPVFQAKRRLRSLLLVCANLVMSIMVIYTLLADHDLAYALIFVPPYSSPIHIWDVLWIVSVTDFVLRLITVLLKLIFVALPPRLLPFQKKGKYYLFIERSSQLYRTIAPMQHWLYFFSESYSGPSKVFGVILSAAYLIFKCKSIVRKAKLWKKTLIKVIQSKTYGVTPSSSQIKEAGEACPICQDDYKSPSMLQCKHIFCEECVALWFDRERTCPICRAQIADDPTWRDGSTTWLHQIF